MFVYRPALLLPAPPMDVAYTLLITGLAMFAACSATIGYLVGPAGPLLRVLLLVDATLFFLPGTASDAAAFFLLAVLVAVRVVRKRRGALSAVKETT
jgi:TRAP-type uncharacterized transport system fused permease subunit